jgi:hypothetical protein
VLARQRERGDVRGFARASAFRGFAAHRVGDLPEAVADLRSALELAEGSALFMLQGFTTAWLVSALVDTGEHRAAEDALTEASSWFSTEAPLAAIYLFDARGRLRLAQGRTEDAVADLAECGRRMEERRAFGPGCAAGGSTWRSPAGGGRAGPGRRPWPGRRCAGPGCGACPGPCRRRCGPPGRWWAARRGRGCCGEAVAVAADAPRSGPGR